MILLQTMHGVVSDMRAFLFLSETECSTVY